jgi:hypothetical protein
MNLSSIKNDVSIHSYSSVADYVELKTAQKHTIGSANYSSDYNYCDDAINDLDIAEGLKSMLISHGFNLRSLLVTKPRDLAETFGIDNYVANLIINAAHNITIEDKKINVSYYNNLWSNQYES